MKKIFRKLHLWLSVPFGLLITLICFSGAMLVFEKECLELLYPDRYFVKEVKEQPLSIDKLLTTVAQTLPDSVSVTSISIPSDPERAYQIGLSKPRRASVYVDQYAGEVKPRFERAPFFMTMFRLHRWLLDSMKPDGGIFWGKMIVGTSTLLFVFILITGIVIWVPRTYKALKNRLKISVSKGWKRFWYDLHVAGGMYTVIILMILSLTGLTWSFQWYRAGFYKVFGVEMQQGGGHGHGAQQPAAATQNSQQQRQNERGNSPRGEGRSGNQQKEGREQRQGERGERGRRKGERNRSPFANWQEVYNQLSAQNPDCNQITISATGANVSFKRFGNQRASDRYTYDLTNGKIIEANLYKDQEKANKIRGWIYSVHVGNWGGMFTRICTFIAALIGASLPLTGYYFWIKRTMNQRKRRKARPDEINRK
ncbi:MAG: PepSY domain-containing protein [Bacteroides sp.]|nr:PepSY domain-containing protein [Bacteroides sp.]